MADNIEKTRAQLEEYQRQARKLTAERARLEAEVASERQQASEHILDEGVNVGDTLARLADRVASLEHQGSAIRGAEAELRRRIEKAEAEVHAHESEQARRRMAEIDAELDVLLEQAIAQAEGLKASALRIHDLREEADGIRSTFGHNRRHHNTSVDASKVDVLLYGLRNDRDLAKR